MTGFHSPDNLTIPTKTLMEPKTFVWRNNKDWQAVPVITPGIAKTYEEISTGPGSFVAKFVRSCLRGYRAGYSLPELTEYLYVDEKAMSNRGLYVESSLTLAERLEDGEFRVTGAGPKTIEAFATYALQAQRELAAIREDSVDNRGSYL